MKIRGIQKCIKVNQGASKARQMAYGELLTQEVFKQMKTEIKKRAHPNSKPVEDRSVHFKTILSTADSFGKALSWLHNILSKLNLICSMKAASTDVTHIQQLQFSQTSLKYQYEALIDLLIDEKKTKDELLSKACDYKKGSSNLKFYPRCIFTFIVKKALTKDAVIKLQSYLLAEEEKFKKMQMKLKEEFINH